MFLRRICCLGGTLQRKSLIVRTVLEQKYRPISCVTRFSPLAQQYPLGSRSDEGFQISDESIQKYLENIRLEYYSLKVMDQPNKKDVKRLVLLSHIVEMYEQRRIIVDNLKSLQEMGSEKDEDMLQLMKEETEAYTNILTKLDNEIMDGILSMDEEEDFNALVLEVAAGVGGQEAMLFAREIFDMYCGFAEYKGWSIDSLQTEGTELGGIRHASIIISGRDAYRYLKFEAGVHRVQRVPATEKAARIHTSTATVSVIPRPDEFHIELKEQDLKIETKRASGAGGQHVNTTDSAVRIVHIPTGIAVECQEDRSQAKNKEMAKQKLLAKLTKQELEAKFNSSQSMKKSQVGSSLRNEKIRTYNYNQDRITDHRVENGTTHNLKAFLEGGHQLDDMVIKLRSAHRKQQLMEIVNSTITDK
ncbi:peptide chain release factor 1-like, mitochondrial [Topomyia yanbarensis]|uniref:peptide chain release factor 1-like, mitochondrial n=1 Tax=Topomyia yanbarensis TaxID=2498891 RepID=UPI00273BF845|nr:peptide chain release factor 1-like, mitochondrial [Topomyia yanbarensis]